MMGLAAGWVTDILPRNPAIKALGNGVVPQQAALALRLLGVTAESAAAWTGVSARQSTLTPLGSRYSDSAPTARRGVGGGTSESGH